MLKKTFFARSAVSVAKDLIGCFLCVPGKKFMIVETEAYEGLDDKASHARSGKTERNKIMFGNPGVWYVYFTYGMHYMLNIVCGPNGHPGAVLVRGITLLPTTPPFVREGEKVAMSLLGPAKLTKYLKIDKSFNGKSATLKTGLWIEPSKFIHDDHLKLINIIKTPRVGVGYAGPVWSKKKYRFVLDGFETKKF